MAQTTKDLIQRYCPDLSVGRYGKIYTDTSDFMRIIYGDVIAVGGKYYLVLRDEVERSYGIEDPKYWVKRCVALETGERRILKLVFHESFTLDIGTLSVRCYRSPAKEARVLDVVRGDNRFMQGYSVNDEEGNEVRILELVSGRRLDQVVADIDADHRMYFFEILPEILEKFIGSCEAIAFLHAHGEKHGDIRRDHLWQETRTGAYRWIDFDYTFEFQENPFGLDLFGLGGLLIFLVGKGFYTLTEMPHQGFDMELLGSLRRDDFSLLFPNRLVNLKRLFPYIPDELNLILLHFSAGAEVFYESVEEFLANLRPCLDLIAKGARAA
jgi:hypothetical protein